MLKLKVAEGYPNHGKIGDYITIVSLVWGGISLGSYANDGAFYDPRTDTWIAISTTDARSPRLFFTAGWDSTNLFIWGGGVDSGVRPLGNGKPYNTVAGVWRNITTD